MGALITTIYGKFQQRSQVQSLDNEVVVYKGKTLKVIVPVYPLSRSSLRIEPINNFNSLADWKGVQIQEAHGLVNRVIKIWQQKGVHDYLIYGKQTKEGKFGYELVPYPKNSWKFWTQFKVLWNITFGGFRLPFPDRQNTAKEHQNPNGEFLDPQISQKDKIVSADKRQDPFCDPKVIGKQLVFQGDKINVLYNYAPIVLGKDKLHFMLVPKEHREKFSDLTAEEHAETVKISQKLTLHFGSGQPTAYIFDKNGARAGQSVRHWHEHIVFTASKTQEMFGKFKVLKNMLLGSSPLPAAELKGRVESLKAKLDVLAL